MKLFLAPKNITGNEKNTDNMNPPFMPKYKTLFSLSGYKFSRKFAFTFSPYIAYPTIPTNIYKTATINKPTNEALFIFESLLFFKPKLYLLYLCILERSSFDTLAPTLYWELLQLLLSNLKEKAVTYKQNSNLLRLISQKKLS